MSIRHAAAFFTVLISCCVVLSTVDRSIAADAGVVDETKQNAPPSPASANVTAACEAAWTAADLNKNGILDPNEATIYSASLSAKQKPPVADTRLNKEEFLKDCEATTAHE